MESPKCAESLVERGVKRVGDYLIERELGRGTFGRVFKCRSAASGATFAVKVIPLARLTTPHARRLLKTEVAVMHAVSHPHVMHLHDFLKSRSNYYLVLDYCEGGDLFAHIRGRPRGYIEEPAAIPLFKQVMNGFAELRKHRVIHRDIKSENVFLRERALVIGDFGLAHVGAETASSYVGSRQFMAPEVLGGPREGALYDSRVDLWAIGCLFYEMLFGEAPFRSQDAAQLLAEIARRSGERLPFPREVSAAARDLLCRLLHPDPQLRLDWHGFFNHALFDAADPAPDPLELPRIANIRAWAEGRRRLEGDFRCNRQAELALPAEPQDAPRPPKQRVEERYSLGERGSPHAAYFEEVTLRYLHERNKLWWTSYVNKKLGGCAADPQLAELRALLDAANLLVAEKVERLARGLLGALLRKENPFGVQEAVFADYLGHPAYGDLLRTLQRDQQALRETALAASAAYRQQAPGWADDGSPTGGGDPALAEGRLKAAHAALFAPCQQLINARPELARKGAYVLALLRTCCDSDAYFPFRRAASSTGKFDWVKFYDKIESGSFEQLVALAR